MRILFVALIVGVCACGDGGGGIELGEDGKPISGLSQAELDTICETLVATQVSQVNSSNADKGDCMLAAIIFSGSADDFDEQACQMTYDTCMDEIEAMHSNFVENLACELIAESLVDCDATVGEYEACIVASKKQKDDLLSHFAGLSCDFETIINAGDFTDLFGGIPACQNLDVEITPENFEPGVSATCQYLELPWGGSH